MIILGAKVNDPLHPDYVPTLFPHNENQINASSKLDRLERVRKRTNSAAKETKARKKLKLIDVQENCETRETAELPVELPVETPVEIPNVPNILCSPIASLAEAEIRPMQTPLQPSEREMLYDEINNLRAERDAALEKVEFLEKLVDSSSLSASSVEGNNEACKNLTGLSWNVFLKLFLFLSRFCGNQGSSSFPLRDQLFVTLVKLRHNLSFDFLAHIKGVPKTTLIDSFWKWMDLLYTKISFYVKWQERDSIFKTIPAVFKSKFPRLTSIIDCFEIFIEAPKNLLARAKCYSQYKKHCTVKVFVSCGPLGNINFISKAWGGRASDIQIVRESGFIDSKYHLPGDQLLADRGFTLHDDFAARCSAELLTPAFTKGKSQLSAQEVETSRKISSVRIHIERVIGLMKNRYTILKGPLPIRCVQSLKDESLAVTLSSCDKIITVCAALTNLGSSIVFKE